MKYVFQTNTLLYDIFIQIYFTNITDNESACLFTIIILIH